MKLFKNIIYVLISAVVLNSCASSNKKEKETLTIREKPVLTKLPNLYIGSLEKNVVAKDGKDSTVLRYDFQFFREPENIWQDSINRLLGENLFVFTSFEENARYEEDTLTLDYFVRQLDAYEQVYRDYEKEDIGINAVWTLDAKNTIDTSTFNNFVQVSTFVAFYTGGAHPNTGLQYKILSKKDGHILKWQEVVENPTEFAAFFERRFKKEQNITSDKQLKEDYFFENGKIVPSDNFEVKDNALVFYYNAYEIAPYASGIISVSVPLKKIKIKLN